MKTVLRDPRAICSLGSASFFVLLLAASAPHRVHHLFENYRGLNHIHPSSRSGATSAVDDHTHRHGHPVDPLHAGTTHNDKNHGDTAQTVCLLQSVSQHSHLSIVSLVEIPFLSTESDERSGRLFLRLSPFNPSPFSQRAPPEA